MILYMTWFSERGRELVARITELSLSVSYGFWQSRYGGHPAVSKIQIRERGNRSLPDFLEEAFAQQFPVIFIGALGIAVRAIAPLIRHKTVDSPVLVLDEAGQFVIPVLSGHLGGANELAQQIAESLHSAAVVTTATDVNGLFAVDVFARKNGLRVCNPEAIRHVSGKLLQGETIVMAVDPACMSPEEMAELQPPKEVKLISWNEAQAEHAVDVWITKKEPQEDRKTLVLAPKTAVLGMGCRKNKSYNEIKQMIKTLVDSRKIDLDDIYALASVDVKEKEPGLQELAQHLRVPFVVFSAGELKKVSGDFTASAFVSRTVGVDNVCERAAVAAADGGSLLIHKQAMDGVTIAVAKREKIVLQFVGNERKEKEMKHRIYVVGMGPGQENMMTQEAMQVLEASDVIIGYTVYLKLLGERFRCKELLSTPMRQERERCQMCFEKAREGKKVALICSGDAGIYGMASLMLEIGKLYDDCIIEVIPGITAASSGAAVLGAPLNHDFCVISLSDLLTPWERIKKRLIAAAEGDFAMAIYNPSSHKRADYLERACRILMEHGVEPERACGYVENIGRDDTKAVTLPMEELVHTPVNMFTTVFIGNSQTKIIDGKLVTPRGYHI